MSTGATNVLSSFGGVASQAGSSGLQAVGLTAGPAGLIASAGLGIVSTVVGIFNHHAQAVKNEAANMNYAVPTYVTQVQMIFAQLNAGQISAAQADIMIDSAVTGYYSQIASILKKSGTCPNDADSCQTQYSGKFIKGLAQCNAACSVGCSYVETIACKAHKLLRTGGTIYIDSFGGTNSALTKQNGFSLSYGNGGVGGVNWSQPSAGGPFGGKTPLALGQVGIATDGTVIPYSQISTAQLVRNANPSIIDAIVPKTSGGKFLLVGAGLVFVALLVASR